MKVLFLDVNNQKISLYGEDGVVEIPFQQTESLHTIIRENEDILYITKAIKTGAQEVIDMVRSMGVQVQENVSISGGQYLHAVTEETIYISEFMVFQGKYDTKPMDENMIKEIEENPLLRQLINSKKIEIIDSRQRRKLKVEYEKIEDKKAGSILIETSVADFQDGKGKTTDAHPDAIVVDLETRGSAVEGGSIETMSELGELLTEMEEI